MEKVLKASLDAATEAAGPAAQVVEVQQAVQEVVTSPKNNNLRDAGIVVVVLVLAAVAAKLYQVTSKKK